MSRESGSDIPWHEALTRAGFIRTHETEAHVNYELPPPGVRQEPPPQNTGGRSVWAMVMDDMQAREGFGVEKYGQPVLAGCGRDTLVDSYQEKLDDIVYTRKLIAERDEFLSREDGAKAQVRRLIEEASGHLHDSQHWFDRDYADDHGKLLVDDLVDKIMRVVFTTAAFAVFRGTVEKGAIDGEKNKMA